MWKQLASTVLETPVAVLVGVSAILALAPFQNVTVAVAWLVLVLYAVIKASAPKAVVEVVPLYATLQRSPTAKPGAVKLIAVLVAEVAAVMGPRLTRELGYAEVAVKNAVT